MSGHQHPDVGQPQQGSAADAGIIEHLSQLALQMCALPGIIAGGSQFGDPVA